jgi:hypothetical protein
MVHLLFYKSVIQAVSGFPESPPQKVSKCHVIQNLHAHRRGMWRYMHTEGMRKHSHVQEHM